MKRAKWILLLMILGNAGWLKAEVASETRAAATRPTADPRAARVLRQTLEKYHGYRTYQEQATLSFVTVDARGVETAKRFDSKLVFERPNKILFVWFTFTLTCDGRRCQVYYPSHQQYTDRPAPARIDMAFLKDAAMNEFLPIVLGALVNRRPYESLVASIEGLTDEGVVEKEGRKLHRIAYLEGPARWDLLIDTETLLFKRITVSPRKVKNNRWEIRIDYSKVSVNEPVPEGAFKITPPAGARKVERISLTRQLDYARLGQAFPDTALTVNGTKRTARVGELLGSRITFVDFWATWCPPCRAELPELEKIYNEYKSRGFQMIGVNLDAAEGADEVRHVIQEMNLTFPMLLDPESRLSEAMQVKSIPMLVVLDATGKIVEAHVGASPNTPAELRAIIEAAVNGSAVDHSDE